MHPANHKTIFVLDHSPYFGTPCESVIEFDFTKSHGPTQFIPLAHIAKSLWTCSVEAAIEYCRIVWDLFPTGKLIRFIVSDNKGTSLNSWSSSEQNLGFILNALARVGVPPRDDKTDYFIAHGLQEACIAMTECSEIQHQKRTALNDAVPPVVNRCRVICMTSVNDESSFAYIEDCFQKAITLENKKAVASDTLIPIDHCELVILNIQSNLSNNIASHQVSKLLWSETYNVKASSGIANKLTNLILEHYDLASTTVTGIPMKEEQNASSSANYDVEIFHPAKAHETLITGSLSEGCGFEMSTIKAPKEGYDYQTVTLKWSTPRGCTSSEMHNCSFIHRITPVDVNSRPSSCLINFLMGGRSVMLEVGRRGGGGGAKALSHLLASHGGQIYMHSLSINPRTVHDDPPSISEGPGGRVTDYRITDFGVFMQSNRLFLPKIHKDNPMRWNRERLDWQTKYWPMTVSATVIFNHRQYLEPILSLMLEPELREADVLKCKQTIYSLMSLEAKHEPLHTVTSGQRGKAPKREEQYRALWAELETFLRAHCHTDKHINVLNCLLEVRSKNPSSEGLDKVEIDQALRQLDQMSCPPPTNANAERGSVIRTTTDSPMSPDGTPSHSGSTIFQSSAQKSILHLYLAKFGRVQPRTEFAGLLSAEITPQGTKKAKLYANFKEKPRGSLSGSKAGRFNIMD